MTTQERMALLPQGQHTTVQQQYRKCGKAGCKTCRTGKGHGPYYYGYTRIDGKLHSHYIGKQLPQQQKKEGTAYA